MGSRPKISNSPGLAGQGPGDAGESAHRDWLIETVGNNSCANRGQACMSVCYSELI